MIARALFLAFGAAVLAIPGCSGPDDRGASGRGAERLGRTSESLDTVTSGYQLQAALPSTASSPSFDQFAASVAVLGSGAVLVGDPSSQNSGFVNVYVPDAPTWTLSQTLTGNFKEEFGAAMAATGSTLVVTSPAAAVGRYTGAGSAQVYACAAGQCADQATISASTPSASVPVGQSVAIDGDTLVVGALAASQFSSGAVYVEVASGGVWSQQAVIESPNADVVDAFGHAVAISGDTLVIGAPAVGESTGEAYVYVRSGATWSQQAQLVAPDGATSDAFGDSVAIAGDMILVGAPNHASGGQAYSGAVYAFNRSGTSWTAATPTLTASDQRTDDSFGSSLAILGGVAAIGAPNKLGPVVGNTFVSALGAVYVFTNAGAGWQQSQKLVPNVTTSNLMFGSSVALGPNVLAVGGPQTSGHAEAFVFGYGPLNGSPCSTGNDCLSTFCADGVCCNSLCSGACDVCLQAAGSSADGVCAPAPLSSAGSPSCAPLACDGANAACPSACSSDAECAAGFYCAAGGTCLAQKAIGATCTETTADCDTDGCRVCSSGFCAQGVCCNAACSGACGVCARSLGATADGQCTALPAGTPGSGCAPYACDGKSLECPTACSVDDDCSAQQYCGADARCHDQKQQGSACDDSAGADCAGAGCRVCVTGFCADGACCDTACTGQCEACNGGTTTGTCTPVTGDPVPPRLACSGTASCKGTCDGRNAQQCAQPGAGTLCAPAACQGAALQPASTCDTEGNCVVPTAQSCGNYQCDPTQGACLVACTDDGDCSAGASCDVTQHKCAQVGPTCEDAYDVRSPSGEVTPCESGYLCVAGACTSHCSTADDCAPGYACDDQRCTRAPDAGGATASASQPASTSPGGAGGCGCALGARDGAAGLRLAFLVTFLCGALIRRRWRQPI